MKRIHISAITFSIFFVVGCDPVKKIEQRQAADALLAASEKCVLSVRDGGLPYDSSRSCNALVELSGVFVQAGGLASDADQEARLKFEQARMQAWMAVALSEGRGKVLKIW